MKECIGMLLIYSAIVIGGIALFGYDLELKEKLFLCLGIFITELFLCLIVFGIYLLE